MRLDNKNTQKKYDCYKKFKNYECDNQMTINDYLNLSKSHIIEDIMKKNKEFQNYTANRKYEENIDQIVKDYKIIKVPFTENVFYDTDEIIQEKIDEEKSDILLAYNDFEFDNNKTTKNHKLSESIWNSLKSENIDFKLSVIDEKTYNDTIIKLFNKDAQLLFAKTDNNIVCLSTLECNNQFIPLSSLDDLLKEIKISLSVPMFRMYEDDYDIEKKTIVLKINDLDLYTEDFIEFDYNKIMDLSKEKETSYEK